MTGNLIRSAAIAAALAVSGSPVLAQDATTPAAPSPAPAATTAPADKAARPAATDTRTDTTGAIGDNDGFDMGWLGLLGLIGLAGLMRRDTRRHDDFAPTTTTSTGTMR
jgi:hypothetical protein